MAWDPIGRQLVFADLQHKEIFTFDPETGRRAIISNRNIGNGIEFGELGGFVVDSVEHRIIMLDKGANQDGTKRWLTQVSFDTGNRRALYSRATDAIQEISEYSLALDPYTHQLFVSHQGQIIALALASGNVSILTDSQQEASNVDRINGSAAIAFDFNRHQLIVSDPLLKNLTSVNVATGQRTRLLPETNDETPSLCWPQALLVVGDKVWIGDQGHADWVSLDLNSGTLGSLLPNANRPHSRCKSTAPVGNTRLETQPNNRPAQYSTSLPVIDSTAQQASAQVVAPTTFQGKFSAIWRIFGSGPMPVP